MRKLRGYAGILQQASSDAKVLQGVLDEKSSIYENFSIVTERRILWHHVKAG